MLVRSISHDLESKVLRVYSLLCTHFHSGAPPCAVCPTQQCAMCAGPQWETLLCEHFSILASLLCAVCLTQQAAPELLLRPAFGFQPSNHSTTQATQPTTTNQPASTAKTWGPPGLFKFCSCAPDSKYDGNDVNNDDNYNHTKYFPRGSNLSKLRLMKCTPGRLLSNSIARGAEHSNTNCLTWIEQMNTDEHLNIIANCLSLNPTLQIYT